MFLHVSVILFTGGVYLQVQGVYLQGGLHPGRGSADPPTRTRKADGMHPNGMVSCSKLTFRYITVLVFELVTLVVK